MIDKLLDFVRKTNPEMTKEKVLEELGKSFTSTLTLIMVSQNGKK